MTFLQQKILDLVKKIPKGRITTYQLLAQKLGNKRLVRFVGSTLAKNPNLIVVPCHRVVKKDKNIGQYALGIAKKRELLQNEGILIKGNKIVNFNNYLYHFN